MAEYEKMGAIGARFVGLTSHGVGDLLVKNGYRTSDKRPSSKAFEENMVKQDFDGYGHYQWIWHVEKTCKLLERWGRRLKDPVTTEETTAATKSN